MRGREDCVKIHLMNWGGCGAGVNVTQGARQLVFARQGDGYCPASSSVEAKSWTAFISGWHVRGQRTRATASSLRRATPRQSRLTMSGLSKRGLACIKPPAEYLLLSFAAWQNEYHPDTNPDGYINLSVAENLLSLPYVAEALSSAPPVPISNLNYGIANHFHDVLARFLSKHVLRVPVKGQHIVALNGATAVLDTLANVLCDSGDAVITTGPGYRGLEDDVGGRSGCSLVIAALDDIPDGEHPYTTVEAFERAWQEAGGENSRIRMAIVLSPNNPTGEVLSRELVLDIVRWGRERNLHLVFDEVYARSIYGDGTTFVSVAEALEGDLGDDVHIVYSFSKDLCISGTRMGVLYSQNAQVLQTMLGFLRIFSSTSRHSQWAIEHVLGNDKWLEDYFEANSIRLRRAYDSFTTVLDGFGIPYMPAESGFFVWVDMRKWMNGDTAEDELVLWRKLNKAKVVVTPASQCFAKRFGFFRVCFAAVPSECVEEAWKRISDVLSTAAEQ